MAEGPPGGLAHFPSMPAAPRRVLEAMGVGAVAFVALALVRPELHDLLVRADDFVTLPRTLYALALVAVCASLIPYLRLPKVAPRPRSPASDRAVPLALGLLVGVSAGAWFAVTYGHSLPLVLGDELIYANLGKSLARGDGVALHGVRELGYGVGYPAFLAPFYRLAPNGLDAFAWIQATQALVMASAAIPTYLLARRLISRRASFLCSALIVLYPGLWYSGPIMTEALFFPAAAWFSLAAVAALDEPTLGRQLVAWLTLGVAWSVRLQAVALVGALLLAVVITPRSGGRKAYLRRWAPTLLGLALGSALALGLALVAGITPLGAYSVLVEAPDLAGALAWGLRSAGVIVVGLGFVTAVAFGLGLFGLMRGSQGERAFAALALGTTTSLLAVVGQFSASDYGLDRIHERNLMALVPLIVIVAMWWATSGLAKTRWAAVTAAAASLAVVVALARSGLLLQSNGDSYSNGPWRDIDGASLPAGRLAILAMLVAIAVTLCTRKGWIVPLTIAAAFIVTVGVEPGPDRTGREQLSWVDDTVGRGPDVLVVSAGIPSRRCGAPQLGQLELWTEFFNIAAGRAAHLIAENPYTGVASPRLTLGEDGVLREGGDPVRADAVAIDARIALAGTPLAELSRSVIPGRSGSLDADLRLWRTDGVVRVVDPQALRALATADCAG